MSRSTEPSPLARWTPCLKKFAPDKGSCLGLVRPRLLAEQLAGREPSNLATKGRKITAPKDLPIHAQDIPIYDRVPKRRARVLLPRRNGAEGACQLYQSFR